MTQMPHRVDGKVAFGNDVSPYGIVHVMIDVGDRVRQLYHFGFERPRRPCGGPGKAMTWLAMGSDTVDHLRCEIQTPPTLLDEPHDAKALLVVLVSFSQELVQRMLTCVSKGRVAQIVRKRDRLRQIFVQPQGARDVACNLRDF
jgi:hypothetical protein